MNRLPIETESKDSHISVMEEAGHQGSGGDGEMIDDAQWNEDEAAMEDLTFITFGSLDEAGADGGVDVARIHWSDNCLNARCDDAKMQIEAAKHLKSADGPPLFFGQLAQPHQAFLMQLSEAYYNLRGDREPEIEGDKVILKFSWQSLTFAYNLATGRASYLLACSDKDFESYLEALGDRKVPASRQPHPFSLHLILLFKSVLNKNEELEESLRRLLLYEDRSIFRRSKVTFESGDATKQRLQELHSLFKELLLGDNSNKRYIASIDSLMRDLTRLQKTIKSTGHALEIDEYSHQRMMDGFRCLKSFCLDRDRRIDTRLQRVRNLIALVRIPIPRRVKQADDMHTKTYNLLANRDSITAHSIAHEARQDGAAMKTIALVTMLFFPATFVSSFLGTNLVTLDEGAGGRKRLVFSHLWWIYLVSAVPLTITTLLAWLYFGRYRSRKARVKWQRAGETEV
ncbi:MAG: hypothetical protein Q9168_007192 [Polycauliona sp. 1 TL-2023]